MPYCETNYIKHIAEDWNMAAKLAKKGQVGLFIGRFQPFHNGHLKAMRWILSRCAKCIIVVGSSQRCYDPENPFTVGERVEMIAAALEEGGMLGKCYIIPATDIMNNALWVAHVSSLVPHYDVVYTNNALNARLFEEAGKKVETVPFFCRPACEGTKIRKMMLAGKKGWEKLVPASTARVIRRSSSIGRIRAVAGKK